MLIAMYLSSLIKMLIDAVVLNINQVASWRWSRTRSKMQPSPRSKPKLIILLPVLNESLVLESITQHILSLPSPAPITLVIITTEREFHVTSRTFEQTTVELAQQLTERCRAEGSNCYHLHYPFTKGNKASQLNFALRWLDANCSWNPSLAYVGVYDADSKPARDTFLFLAREVDTAMDNGSPWPIAIQQPGMFLANFHLVSLYMKVEALCEIRRVLAHEISTMRSSVSRKCSLFAPYAYCVGHGMFLRQDFLSSVRGYPEPSEDVPMGHLLDFMGIPIVPLPCYDLCEVAPNLRELVKQSVRWFRNAPLIFREFGNARRLQLPIMPLRSTVILLQGCIDIFSWVHYPINLMALVLLGVTRNTGWLWACSLIAMYLDYGVGVALSLLYLPSYYAGLGLTGHMGLSPTQSAIAILLAPLRGFIRSIGPVLACLEALGAISGLSTTKTERQWERRRDY